MTRIPTAMICRIGNWSGKSRSLIVPYALDTNDMRFATAQGFNSGDQFFAYLKDAFDVLYTEGESAPKMLSIACIAASPAGPRAWPRWRVSSTTCRNTTGSGSAGAWRSPATGPSITPTLRRRDNFDPANRYDGPGGVRCGSRRHLREFALVAQRAWTARPFRSRDALHATMEGIVAAAGREEQLALIRAHPELAGRLALAGQLSGSSRSEQAGAGLDCCTPDEFAAFGR